jgi:tetratricopeptide (TPR) repeat protein
MAFLLALLAWSGCSPISGVNEDEEKNPYYLAGKSRVNSMDYQGAIESFEKALESNPRSASAHFELGLLYEQRMNDYATAIYHYQKHLNLRPKSNMAESVRQRIASCKVDLAKSVAFSLVNQQVHSQLTQLTTENAALREEIRGLKEKSRLAQEAALPSNRPAPVANSPPANPVFGATNRAPAPSERVPSTAAPPIQTRPPATARTHLVKRGETMASIAREYGLDLPKLLAANPTVEPRRLRAGQTITVPPP